MSIDRTPIFDAVRTMLGRGFKKTEIADLDSAIDKAEAGTVPSAACEAIIREFESERLAAYPDPATGGDPWTIGVGHTGPEVHKGMTITKAQSAAYLASDMGKAGAAVARLCPITTQGQFDALLSFTFNLGEGNLASSTLRKKHNAGDYAGAKTEFARWNKAAGKMMNGLTRRRAAESKLYAR